MSAVDFNTLTAQGELSLDDILTIEQAGSEKGIYQRDLLDFIHGGKLGVPYVYSGKAAQSVKMGFEGAKTALGKKEEVSAEDKATINQVEVKIRKVKSTVEGQDDQEFVFLINNQLVAEARAAQSGAATVTEAPAQNDGNNDEEVE